MQQLVGQKARSQSSSPHHFSRQAARYTHQVSTIKLSRELSYPTLT